MFLDRGFDRGPGLQPVPTARRAAEGALHNYPYVLAASACVGLAAANAAREHRLAIVALAVLAAGCCAFASEPIVRVGLISVALLLGGWWCCSS